MRWFHNVIRRIRQWWCAHKLVSHEWEWTPMSSQWQERYEWTCLACEKDFLTPPSHATRMVAARPVLDAEMTATINMLVEQHGAEAVRVRGTKLQPENDAC